MIRMSTSEIPNAQQLSHLPLRALAAVAARVGRRVESRARPADRKVLDEAIGVAERFARGERGLAEVANRAAAIAGDRASEASREGHDLAEAGTDSASYFRASAAATSAAYVAHAIHLADDTNVGDVPRVVQAAVRVASYVDRRVAAATVADFERLREQATEAFPELGPAVDVGEDGPLGTLWPGQE